MIWRTALCVHFPLWPVPPFVRAPPLQQAAGGQEQGPEPRDAASSAAATNADDTDEDEEDDGAVRRGWSATKELLWRILRGKASAPVQAFNRGCRDGMRGVHGCTEG